MRVASPMNALRKSAMWGVFTILGYCGSLHAQTLQPSRDELQQQMLVLQQRLEAAESRLRELESSAPAKKPPPVPLGPESLWKVSRAKSDDVEQKPEDRIFGGGNQPNDLAERLGTLEKGWEKFQDDLAKKKNEAAEKPTFSIGGRIHFDSLSFLQDDPGIGYFEHPATGVDPEDRVFFRRIRLETGGQVFESMLYRMQVDFADPRNPAYKDVYIGFTKLPGNHTVLFGNQKRPLGLDALNSSRFNVFMERPLAIEAFNEDARRIGAMAYTYTDDLRYNLRYGVFLLENTQDDGAFLGDPREMSGNFRLASIPWYDETSGGRGYFHWAVSGMLAHPDGNPSPPDSEVNEARFRTRSEIRSDLRWLNTGRIAGAQWFETAGLEALFNYGPLQIVGEQQFNWTQRDNVTPGTGPDLFFHGGYIYAAYFLTGEHVPIDRKTSTIKRTKPFENFFLIDRLRGGTAAGWGAWQVALRLSYVDLTNRDIQGGVGRNVTFGLNWWWTAHSRLQLNLVRGNITDHAPVGGYTAGDFWALGTRMAVDF